jgi:hypothetical protein
MLRLSVMTPLAVPFLQAASDALMLVEGILQIITVIRCIIIDYG